MYLGPLQAVNWKDLEEVKKVAAAVDGVVGKHPNRTNYNIYGSVENAVRDGATVVWPEGGENV